MAKTDLAGERLCKLTKGDFDYEALSPLVRGAKYICAKCGRAAVRKKNLCAPRKLAKG